MLLTGLFGPLKRLLEGFNRILKGCSMILSDSLKEQLGFQCVVFRFFMICLKLFKAPMALTGLFGPF